MQVVQLVPHGSHKPIVVADADQLEAGGDRTPADTPRGPRRLEGERRRLPPSACCCLAPPACCASAWHHVVLLAHAVF